MQSTSSAGFFEASKKDVLMGFKYKQQSKKFQKFSAEEQSVIRVQRAWRRRQTNVFLPALKQSNDCRVFRENRAGGVAENVVPCTCCSRGNEEGRLAHQIESTQFHHLSKLLFQDQFRQNVSDNGENWNQRFQSLLNLPEKTVEDRIYKFSCLSSLNNDFVAASTLYGKAIISEFFVHSKDKTVVDRSDFMGGIAGGKKFLWRGILFKLADGSVGPWNGSDENAAKAAGHELRSTIQYFAAGMSIIGHNIRYPLMTLIDYCGFRMVCMAFLPISSRKSEDEKGEKEGGIYKASTSLIYGSNDAGKTIHSSNATFNGYMKQLSQKLNLKPHLVGRNRKELVEMCCAVDAEGHWGKDGLFYLLDLQRAFPPEAPIVTKHLNTVIPTGVKVRVVIPNANAMASTFEVEGIILKGHLLETDGGYEGTDVESYDVIIVNTCTSPSKVQVLRRVPVNEIIHDKITIFHRLLRPEYVQHRGEHLTPLDPDDLAVSNGTGGVTNNEDTNSSMTTPIDGEGGNEGVLRESMYAMYDNFAETLAHKSLANKSLPATLDKMDSNASIGYQTSTASTSCSPMWVPSGDKPGHISCPLSSDALSLFAKYDPEVHQRNKDVIQATERLCSKIVPMVAINLIKQYIIAIMFSVSVASTTTADYVAEVISAASMQPLKGVKLTQYLHKQGINMRHLGLLRNCVNKHCGTRYTTFIDEYVQKSVASVGQVTPSVVDSAIRNVEKELLNQIVTRTLKNILKDFQRKWMRSEQSTSEEGMKILITQFLNVVTGNHANSLSFWKEYVIPGIYQRFGRVALINSLERNNLHRYVSDNIPFFLQNVIRNLTERMGIVIHSCSVNKFYSCSDPSKFEFIAIDIVKIEAKVKYLYIIDEINAKLLEEYATIRMKSLTRKTPSNSLLTANPSKDSIVRLHNMAFFHYDHLLQSIPASSIHTAKYEALKKKTGEEEEEIRRLRGMQHEYSASKILHVDENTKYNGGSNLDIGDDEDYYRMSNDMGFAANRRKKTAGGGCCQS